MENLQFGNIEIIGRNNRKNKIHKLGKIKVIGLKIKEKCKKKGVDLYKYRTKSGFNIGYNIFESVETLEMLSVSEFIDAEGVDVKKSDYDFIIEIWDFNRKMDLIHFDYEFIIYEK